MSDYPEHDKLSAVKSETQAQGEFLQWVCDEEGIYLRRSINELLAEYHEIDLDKIETEKRAMLAKIREEDEKK